MPRPEAVLIDVGGVLLLPERDRILGAFSRSLGVTPPPRDALDRAHYAAAARFTTDLDVEADWAACWKGYLDGYIAACGVDPKDREEVHRHLDSEFADAALWVSVIPGCREGLRAVANTGVRLGVISNADGLMAVRLQDLGILQVGPGEGVEVECFIDSGVVGVMKPDPRIFRLALEAMSLEPEDSWYLGDMPAIDVVGARRAGIRPFLIDPLDLHGEADYDRVESLHELAKVIESS